MGTRKRLRCLVGRVVRRLELCLGYRIVKSLPGRELVPPVTCLPPVPAKLSGVRHSSRAIWKLLSEYEFNSVLDVGSGPGSHAALFAAHGKEVVAVDFGRSCYFMNHEKGIEFICGNYVELELDRKFDVVWASHVLEHQVNAQIFLRKMMHDCRVGGVLAITVPPRKDAVVGGHLSLWNAGLLMYNLVVAGCDCSSARVLRYGYNVSVLVEYSPISAFPLLSYDSGDIGILSRYFPDGLEEGFDGDISSMNW